MMTTRRGVAATTVALLLVAVALEGAVTKAGVRARDLAAAGTRSLEAGDTARAIERLARSVASGPTASALYNLGVLRLATGDAAEASDAFAASLEHDGTPEVRRKALHNLSRAELDRALAAAPGEVVPPALAAVAAGRAALRLMPTQAGTRRNLALADRLLTRPTSERTARDGGIPLTNGGSGGSDAAPSDGGMSPAEARMILDAIRSAESADLREVLPELTAGPLLPRNRRGPPW